MLSRDRLAADAFHAVTTALGPGTHHIVVSGQEWDSPTVQVFTAQVEVTADAAPAMPSPEFGDLLADVMLGIPGGIIARTSGPAKTYAVRGWFIAAGWFHAMTAAEIFNAYCAPHGELLPPEPGVSYEAGHPIPRPVRA
ncbi:hypothetical protein [Streptomyces sp. NPDC026673]|uniref:hypothetical protein n=1 Tax=Streptomyces sp. NPDC026673 TaxID=3155724 RepID=UPI0033C53752